MEWCTIVFFSEKAYEEKSNLLYVGLCNAFTAVAWSSLFIGSTNKTNSIWVTAGIRLIKVAALLKKLQLYKDGS